MGGEEVVSQIGANRFHHSPPHQLPVPVPDQDGLYPTIGLPHPDEAPPNDVIVKGCQPSPEGDGGEDVCRHALPDLLVLEPGPPQLPNSRTPLI
eukprot:404325-Rhodomonas_salina.1